MRSIHSSGAGIWPYARVDPQRAGIPARIFDAAPEMAPDRRGHTAAAREQGALRTRTESELSRSRRDARGVFYNRFGQLIFWASLLAGRLDTPRHTSIHRGDLQRCCCARAKNG
jgi:hypothetical protein